MVPLFLKLLMAALAIGIGSGGMIALFYGANGLVERFTQGTRQQRLLPWVFLTPALLLLGAYLVIPTILTFYISLLDGRSQAFVGLTNYTTLLTTKDIGEAFCNNLFWLVDRVSAPL